jgi:hypothetical protein
MDRGTNMRALGVALVAAVVAAGCAGGQQLVRKEQAETVKKIAIISVYAPEKIEKNENKSSSPFGFVSAMVDKAKDHAIDKLASEASKDRQNRVRIAQFVHDSYVKHLQDSLGWEVLPAQNVVALTDYQSYGSELNPAPSATSKMVSFDWVAPEKFWRVELTEEQAKKQGETDRWKALCEKLGVDAVAVVQYELAYKPGTLSVGGNGMANTLFRSTIRAFTRAGQFALHGPTLDKMKWQEGKNITMAAGHILVKGDTEKAYQEAIELRTKADVTEIGKGLGRAPASGH